MKKVVTRHGIVSVAITALALICGVNPKAGAQTAKDLVGTWALVSVVLEKDGQKTDMYGPNPTGQFTYGSDGHFSNIIIGSDLPKFASSNRREGTPEENQAVVQGSLAFFGTYTVDETGKIYTAHIDSSTFPNWTGTDRKEAFSISGDELHIDPVSKPSTGTGTPHLVLKRTK